MDAKFANAGEGHKLTEDTRAYRPQSVQHQPNVRTRPMSSSQAQAGAAALARHEEKSKQTKIVKPTVMSTRLKKEEIGRTSSTSMEKNVFENNVPEKNNASTVESFVMFHSPFTDEVIAKIDLKNHMRENLLLRLSENPVEASSLMIETLTSSQEKKSTAINTLNKYIDNIINNPDDVKYRKIRKSNKAFSEKVALVEGTEEFLEAIGFQKTLIENEIFFLMNSVDVDNLREARDILASAVALEFRIFRDPKVFLPADAEPPRLSFSDDFYKLTSSEVKQEHDRRAEDIELGKQLRTKVMREAGKSAMKFNYTIIRVKFPDQKVLQGTFRANETVEILKEFIRQNINVNWAVFTLKTALGESIEKDDATLSSYKLVPSALLNLTWNEEIRCEILKEQGINLSLMSIS